MKRQSRASTARVGSRKDPPEETEGTGTTGASAPKRQRTPFSVTTPVRPASIERNVALSSVGARMHTIVLIGELTHRSAHELEVEIERLCAEGVTGITLDLRELAYIDAIGVAVIAFRSGLCRRRGYDFALIAGSPLMCRAFEQAGVESVLTNDREEAPVASKRALALAGAVGEEREA